MKNKRYGEKVAFGVAFRKAAAHFGEAPKMAPPASPRRVFITPTRIGGAPAGFSQSDPSKRLFHQPHKGSAIIELVLILPLFCLLLMSLDWLFQLGIQEQKKVIQDSYEQRKILETKTEN